MAGIGDMFTWLMGGAPAGPPPPPMPAAALPPMEGYPTPEDAAYARKYDFGYGTGNEPYTQGNVARVLGQQYGKHFEPMSADGMKLSQVTSLALDDQGSRNIDLRTPDTAPVSDKLGTTLAQAALAANRMPVAGYGYDPGRAAIDVVTDDANIGGAYSPSKDSMYVGTGGPDPSAIVHESLHRGLKKLRDDPSLKDLWRNLPSKEETIVRYLMAMQGGDPEKGGGPVDQRQREEALRVTDSGIFKDGFRNLNRAAEDAIARQRPGGPR